jgi:hypothetical protein
MMPSGFKGLMRLEMVSVGAEWPSACCLAVIVHSRGRGGETFVPVAWLG